MNCTMYIYYIFPIYYIYYKDNITSFYVNMYQCFKNRSIFVIAGQGKVKFNNNLVKVYFLKLMN